MATHIYSRPLLSMPPLPVLRILLQSLSMIAPALKKSSNGNYYSSWYHISVRLKLQIDGVFQCLQDRKRHIICFHNIVANPNVPTDHYYAEITTAADITSRSDWKSHHNYVARWAQLWWNRIRHRLVQVLMQYRYMTQSKAKNYINAEKSLLTTSYFANLHLFYNMYYVK